MSTSRASQQPSDILREVLLQLATGTAIGLPFALAAARLAESLFFGVAATDPSSYAFAAIGLAAVGGLAAWVPARRACSFQPSELLRRA